MDARQRFGKDGNVLDGRRWRSPGRNCAKMDRWWVYGHLDDKSTGRHVSVNCMGNSVRSSYEYIILMLTSSWVVSTSSLFCCALWCFFFKFVFSFAMTLWLYYLITTTATIIIFLDHIGKCSITPKIYEFHTVGYIVSLICTHCPRTNLHKLCKFVTTSVQYTVTSNTFLTLSPILTVQYTDDGSYLTWCDRNIREDRIECRQFITGVISSGNAWERRSQSYFDSGNGVPRNEIGLVR